MKKLMVCFLMGLLVSVSDIAAAPMLEKRPEAKSQSIFAGAIPFLKRMCSAAKGQQYLCQTYFIRGSADGFAIAVVMSDKGKTVQVDVIEAGEMITIFPLK